MENEKRLIDITPLVDECEECMSIEWNHKVTVSWADAEEEFMQRLLDAPVVDAVEVVHGRWVKDGDWLVCLNCESEINVKNSLGVKNRKNYCPNCGAKMDGDGNG